MKKEVKEQKNIKKIVIEMILIPLCTLYLCYTILNNHPKTSFIILIIFTIITSLELAIKYLKQVYIYENKYNPLRVIFGIFNIVLIIISGLTLIYKTKLLTIIFLIMIIILLGFLLITSIINIKDIIKQKGTLYKKAFSAFLKLNAFVIILMSLILTK